MDPEELEKHKIEVVRLLRIIETRIDICVENGMIDQDSILYNKTDDLVDDAKVVETPFELMEIVNKAKVIEINLDRWLVSKGQTTIGLPWPYFEEAT